VGSVLSSCAYCGRQNVPAAPATTDVIFLQKEVCPIIFTSMGMCSDCAEVTSRFIAKGLAAFRSELSNVANQRQIQSRRPMTEETTKTEVESFLKSLKLNG
jgi:hypothetical protein